MPTPERTTDPAIVAAGRELLEAEGLSGLTMSAVANRVGVRAPSLYQRVRDRQALLVAVAQATVDDLGARLAATGTDLTRLVWKYREYVHEHPGACRLMFSGLAPQDSLERCVDPVVRATTELVSEENAPDAAWLVTAWSSGFFPMELAGAFRLGGDVEQAFAYGLDHLLAGLAVGSESSVAECGPD